jgi:subtilisin family serine protease
MRPQRLWTALVLIIAVSHLRAAEPPTYVPNEIVVRFRAPLTTPSAGLSSASFSSLPAGAARALSSVPAVQIVPMPGAVRGPGAYGLSAQAVNAFEPLTRTYRVKLAPGSDVTALIAALSRDAAVEVAEPNYLYHLSQLPNDTTFSQQWHHRNTGQLGSQDGFDPSGAGTIGVDIQSEQAWDTETGSSGMVVAIIDSGLDRVHPDISGNLWTNAGETNNGLDDDGNGLIDDLNGWDFGDDDNNVAHGCPDSGHGTHVAGIVAAAGNNGIGVAGVNWDAQLMPLKVSADSIAGCFIDSLDVAAAITYATNKSAKVINMSLGGPHSVAVETAANAAQTAGVVLVAAAGNETNSDPSGSYPAALASVIGVAATDRKDARASYSNFGSWVSLAAPGTAIRSTLPIAEGSYGFLSGTSMASPVVAGIAALVRSQYPALNPAEVEARLLASCESIGSSGVGAGRVNAVRALLNLTAISPTQAPAGQAFTATLTGVALHSGVSFRLTKTGVSNVVGTSVNVTAQNSATCSFNVPAASTGVYNVQVVIGNTIITLPNAITIFGLNITDASPSVWPTGAPTGSVTLTGQNFGAGMSVHLAKSGQADIAGTSLVINSQSSATVEFDLTSAARGRWDVVVTSGPFTVPLSRGLAVTTPQYQVVTPPVGTASQFTMAITAGTLTLDWPANATSSPIDVDIDGAPVLPAVDQVRDPFVGTGVGVDLEQVGASPTFAASYRLTLPFQLSNIPDPTKLSALSIAFFNTVTNRWEPLKNITVDAVAGTVSGSSNHFSHYQIVQHVPSSDLNRSIAFPNPFRPDRGHDRIVFDFLTAGSSVKIFDVSGQLVRELTDDDGDGRIDWVGAKNEDGENVASGVYYYLAEGGGSTKSGRVAVVR